MPLFTKPTLELNEFAERRDQMVPALTYPTAAARRDDLHRDVRRRRASETRIREEFRRARQPAMTHRPRSTLIAGH